ncbi:MAG: M23 family metallopeptidase [Luteibaculum sp.]
MLSQSQIKQLEAWLGAKPIGGEAFDELLDHLICGIEHRMISGQSFPAAFSSLKSEFDQQDFIAINRTEKQIRLKRKIMISSPFIFVTAIALVFSINNLQSHNPWKLPLEQGKAVKMTSGFGYRIHPISKTKKLHRGMDFIAPAGTPVNPVLAGVVTKVKHQTTGYGNHIELTHNDSTKTRYAQLEKTLVKVGDRVDQNQIIGTVGSSGTSTGPHLHFEVLLHGKAVNPSQLDSIFHF